MAHKPTDANRGLIKGMATVGVPIAQIAGFVGISETTLRKYYGREVMVGAVQANAKVAETLYKVATDITHPRCVTAGIFWAKTRMGWKETTALEFSGQIEAGATGERTIDVESMDPAARRALLRAVRTAPPSDPDEADDAANGS